MLVDLMYQVIRYEKELEYEEIIRMKRMDGMTVFSIDEHI